MAETEQVRGAVYRGRMLDNKRWIYQFDNPKGGNYPLKVAAFESKRPEDAPADFDSKRYLPKMEEGKAYDFPMENKPIPDSDKFYHNFVRKAGYDSEYVYAESGIESAPISDPKSKQATPALKSAQPQPAKPDAREQYWQNKDARDIKNDAIREAQWEASQAGMRWGNSITAASVIVAALIGKGIIKDTDSATSAIIVTARNLEQTGPTKPPEKKSEAK